MAIDLEKCRENFIKRQAIARAQREELRQQAYSAAVNAILKVACNYDCITQMYLFGSATVPGQFSDRSDIDIAVAGTDGPSYFALWGDLEVECPHWFIDLREINQLGHFADIVRQTGELIYDAPSPHPPS